MIPTTIIFVLCWILNIIIWNILEKYYPFSKTILGCIAMGSLALFIDVIVLIIYIWI